MKLDSHYLVKSAFPLSTACLSSLTFLISASLAFYLHGSLWSTVSIRELRVYGGLDFNHLINGEIWRLATAQLVHVKQLHMLFNVLCLALMGISLEPIIGKAKIILIWFVCGSFGLLASVFFGQIPYEVGTGASQAVLGFVAVNCVVISRGCHHPKWLKAVVLVILGVSLLLDLKSVHYPKAGHVVGFIVGLAIGYLIVPKKQFA